MNRKQRRLNKRACNDLPDASVASYWKKIAFAPITENLQLNSRLGGLIPGELIIVLSQAGGGRTRFVEEVIKAIPEADKTTFYNNKSGGVNDVLFAKKNSEGRINCVYGLDCMFAPNGEYSTDALEEIKKSCIRNRSTTILTMQVNRESIGQNVNPKIGMFLADVVLFIDHHEIKILKNRYGPRGIVNWRAEASNDSLS